MKQPPGISPQQAELNNSALGGFDRAVRDVIPQIQAALEKEHWPMPAPVGCKNGRGDPPGEPEKPARESSSGPARDPSDARLQLNAKSITSVFTEDNSAPEKSAWPPLPPALIDAIADAAIEALPGIQARLLGGGVISAPIVCETLPEEATPARTIPCKVELRLALSAEGRGVPSYCFYDRDPNEKFCRLVVLNLNVSNRAIRSCLSRPDIGTTRFFAGLALAKSLLRSGKSALEATLLAEVKTRAGIAPNSRLSTATFARVLARSALLEPIEGLPIFGPVFASALGRSFRLGEIALQIPTSELGPPWNRSPSGTKGTPNHG